MNFKGPFWIRMHKSKSKNIFNFLLKEAENELWISIIFYSLTNLNTNLD